MDAKVFSNKHLGTNFPITEPSNEEEIFKNEVDNHYISHKFQVRADMVEDLISSSAVDDRNEITVVLVTTSRELHSRICKMQIGYQHKFLEGIIIECSVAQKNLSLFTLVEDKMAILFTLIPMGNFYFLHGSKGGA